MLQHTTLTPKFLALTARPGIVTGCRLSNLPPEQRMLNNYRQQYADNQNISFLPAILSTSTGEFLRPVTELQSRTRGGKAAVLQINLNIEGCSIVAAPVHAPSRAPLLFPLLSHNLPLTRVH